ncbi:GntR family transcriptional regulator [Pseudonocardia nematodicida]|uniref:GntR family transcriptional regulator n=1 Tax=Pseudonocardia nematodicida TaxID=1206997 RepID=A0ABV1KI00_9PSEU
MRRCTHSRQSSADIGPPGSRLCTFLTPLGSTPTPLRTAGPDERTGADAVTTGAERAYEELRAAILRGEFEPGAKLNETTLANRFEVSRTPVREALRKLGRDGLVEVETNRGARIIRWTDDDLREVFALRAVLEGHAAALAAELRTDAEMAVIERALSELDELGNRHDPEAAELRSIRNAALHSAIVTAAHSPRLPRLLDQLISVNAIARNFDRYSVASIERSQNQHHDIVRAIRRRNPDLARAAIRTHLLTAAEILTDPADGAGARDDRDVP